MSTRPKVEEALGSVIDEVQGMLLTRWAMRDYLRHLPASAKERESRSNLIVCMTLEAFEREILMGLCRLDDEKNVSFQSTKKTVMKAPAEYGLAQADLTQITDAVKKYRQIINSAKTQKRNSYIAHLSKDFEGTFPAPEDLDKLLCAALETLEVFLSERRQFDASYTKDGSTEQVIERLDEFYQK